MGFLDVFYEDLIKLIFNAYLSNSDDFFSALRRIKCISKATKPMINSLMTLRDQIHLRLPSDAAKLSQMVKNKVLLPQIKNLTLQIDGGPIAEDVPWTLAKLFPNIQNSSLYCGNERSYRPCQLEPDHKKFVCAKSTPFKNITTLAIDDMMIANGACAALLPFMKKISRARFSVAPTHAPYLIYLLEESNDVKGELETLSISLACRDSLAPDVARHLLGPDFIKQFPKLSDYTLDHSYLDYIVTEEPQFWNSSMASLQQYNHPLVKERITDQYGLNYNDLELLHSIKGAQNHHKDWSDLVSLRQAPLAAFIAVSAENHKKEPQNLAFLVQTLLEHGADPLDTSDWPQLGRVNSFGAALLAGDPTILDILFKRPILGGLQTYYEKAIDETKSPGRAEVRSCLLLDLLCLRKFKGPHFSRRHITKAAIAGTPEEDVFDPLKWLHDNVVRYDWNRLDDKGYATVHYLAKRGYFPSGWTTCVPSLDPLIPTADGANALDLELASVDIDRGESLNSWMFKKFPITQKQIISFATFMPRFVEDPEGIDSENQQLFTQMLRYFKEQCLEGQWSMTCYSRLWVELAQTLPASSVLTHFKRIDSGSYFNHIVHYAERSADARLGLELIQNTFLPFVETSQRNHEALPCLMTLLDSSIPRMIDGGDHKLLDLFQEVFHSLVDWAGVEDEDIVSSIVQTSLSKGPEPCTAIVHTLIFRDESRQAKRRKVFDWDGE
jgi:hypothetical protein